MTLARPGLLLLPILFGLVAGCSDGSGDGSAFESLGDDYENLVDDIEGEDYTDPASLPTTGTARYEGVVGLDFESVDSGDLEAFDMAGDIELTVNFAGSGDPITGRAGNFVTSDDEAVDGALIIDDGVIDRGANPDDSFTYTADMDGVLTTEDGTNWDVDTYLLGDFSGEEHEHALGYVGGTGCTAAGCGLVDGGFVAER